MAAIIIRKALFYISRHLLSASTFLHNFTIFWHCSWSPFLITCIDFMRTWSICVPLQNPVGTKMAPHIDLVAPKWLWKTKDGCSNNVFLKTLRECIGSSSCLCFSHATIMRTPVTGKKGKCEHNETIHAPLVGGSSEAVRLGWIKYQFTICVSY